MDGGVLQPIETISSQNPDVPSGRHAHKKADRDRVALALLGKRQVLRRNFGFLSMLCFSCTILCTWEGTLVLLATGFLNGGPIGLLGQFVFVWAGTFCTFVTIGELVSMAPTAGGQYHWVAMLAPRSIRNFMSYITGWMTVFAWIAIITSGAFLTATMIQSLCLVDWPDYADTYARYQGTLITWAVIIVCVFFNTVVGSILPQAECAFLILHIFGFFAILIPLVYYAPKHTAAELFSASTGYLNEGHWPSYGLSFLVGALGAAFSFTGADAAVHMSEEVTDAAINVPRCILMSLIINGTLGFAMLIAVLFCLGDPQAALEAQATIGFPFMEVFLSATSSVGGASVMISIIITLAFTATVGFLATASRTIWSFARDQGLPFSDAFSKVSSRSTVPTLAIIAASVIPCLLVLINIGSTVAFTNITSLALVGLLSTYSICCMLLLYRRLDGSIESGAGSGKSIFFHSTSFSGSPPVHIPAFQDKYTGRYVLTWGPWRVKGWLGVLNNLVAVCYLAIIWLLTFFPPSLAPRLDAANMNYSSLMFGAVVVYSIVYYLIWGRRQYHGPIIEHDGFS